MAIDGIHSRSNGTDLKALWCFVAPPQGCGLISSLDLSQCHSIRALYPGFRMQGNAVPAIAQGHLAVLETDMKGHIPRHHGGQGAG